MSDRQRSYLLHHELSSQIIRAFYDAYNGMVRGLLEGCYQNALYIELKLRGIPVEREVPFDVRYKGRVVGEYRVDLLVDRKAIVECKTADTLLYFGSKPLFRRFVHANGSTDSTHAGQVESADVASVTPTPPESAARTAAFHPVSRC